ncbi:hypothetical protein vseg_005244 [Gypsophila vaccaria]
MELLFELFLTVSLSLIFTSLFIKLFSMNSTTDEKGTEKTLQMMDKFQRVPFEDETVKVQECQDEVKSRVEFHRVVGVEKEEKIKYVDEVALVDSSTKSHDKIISLEDKNDDVDFGSNIINDPSDEKMCEIEIESVEEEEEEEEEEEVEEEVVECEGGKNDEEMIDDWEQIGRKDYEEIIGINNK